MDDFSVEITDLEYAVMRLNQSFSRWQSECMGAVLGVALSGQENALMHVIHMHERPKTIRDLLHMTNRQDVANMQYELRKLIKSGLIEKNGTARHGTHRRVLLHDIGRRARMRRLRSVTPQRAAQDGPVDLGHPVRGYRCHGLPRTNGARVRNRHA